MNCESAKAKRRIVAQRPEVAEVVRDALALEHQRAQPSRARRRHHREQRLGGLRVGPREGDGGIARHAPGQAMPFGDREVLEALVDSLVGESEPLLQPQHLLADDRRSGNARAR
jgi:hypothetical protein